MFGRKILSIDLMSVFAAIDVKMLDVSKLITYVTDSLMQDLKKKTNFKI